MTEHTKEPWRVVRGSIFGAGDDLVLGSEYGHLSDEDTHRILACVNACAGIDTVELEIIVRRSLSDEARLTALGIAAKAMAAI